MTATTTADPRPLADLEQDALARVEAEFVRRARGARPWTTAEYVDRIEQVHIRFNHRRQWLRTHEQGVAS
jgi:transposase